MSPSPKQLPLRRQTGESIRSLKAFPQCRTEGLPPPKKRALIIAIKDYGPGFKGGAKLRWVHDDAREMRDLLRDSLGFRPEDIIVMMDLPEITKELQPTHANIMKQLELFMKGQNAGDTFFLMYAGHCSQQENLDGTERAGQDQYLIPMDDSPNDPKKILDNTLYDLLVKPLLPKSKLIAVMDTCHSATLLDLPHDRCNRISRWTSSIRRSIRSVLERVPWLLPEDGPSVASSIGPVGQAIRRSGSTLSQLATPVKCTVKFCSGLCRRSFQGPDKPLAVNMYFGMQGSTRGPRRPKHGQSVSQAFITALKKDPNPVLKDLMRSINANVKTAERERKQALREQKKLDCSRKRRGVSVVPAETHSTFKPIEAQLSSLQPLYMSTRLPL
ncbi:caspase domain-containing protein [Infundibulicybe gibba]|nr:caspase domain-containing protein [Infundibulicybe gibba]